MADNGELTPKQKRFVAAMMTSRTIYDAAAAAGIGNRTADRYMATPAVYAALSEAHAGVLRETTRRLGAGMSAALDTLEAVHTDPHNPPGVRVSAARAWCDATLKYGELADLAQRVADLEIRVSYDDLAKTD